MGKTVVQLTSRHIPANPHHFGKADRPRIQARFHPHHHGGGFIIPRHDRTLDRRGAAPSRQFGGVHVETAVAGGIENPLRQDKPVRDNDGDIRLKRLERPRLVVTFE